MYYKKKKKKGKENVGILASIEISKANLTSPVNRLELFLEKRSGFRYTDGACKFSTWLASSMYHSYIYRSNEEERTIYGFTMSLWKDFHRQGGQVVP